MTRLAHLISDHARRVLLISAFAFAFSVAFGAPVVGMLSTESDDFLAARSQSIAARETVDNKLGRSARFGVMVLVPKGVSVSEVERIVAADPQILATKSPASSADPLLRSSDGTKSIVAAAAQDDDAEIAERLRERVPDGVLIGGPSITAPEVGDKVSEDLARAEILAFPLLFLLSLWVFRGLIAALLPPLVGVVTIMVTFLLLRFVNAEVTGISIFAVNLVTGLGLGLGIDYSLFIVSRFREELAGGVSTRDALAATLRTAGRTVLFSSLTVAAAMASLLVFPLRFLTSMGIGGVLGAAVAGVVALTVLPAVLALLGPRVDALSPKRWRRASAQAARPDHRGSWYRLAKWVLRRPGLVALTTGLLLIAIGLPFTRIDFVAADHKMLPVGNEARVVTQTLENEFPGGTIQAIDVVARAPASEAPAVRRLAREIAAIPGSGPVAKPRAIASDVWLIKVNQEGDPLTDRNIAVVRELRGLDAPFGFQVASQGSAFLDQRSAIASSLPLAIFLLAVTTLLTLFVMTGSVVLPVKALVMNLLTISATFGLLVLIFQDGRLERLLDYSSVGGVEQSQPVLLFAIIFGLTTDYGVFLLSRIKEARDSGAGERESVCLGVERTGRIITAAALLFCVAIGAFATSGVLFVKQIGVGIALGVAIDATIVRALLVPALMGLLGRWNWWAPGPLRRLHSRIGLTH